MEQSPGDDPFSAQLGFGIGFQDNKLVRTRVPGRPLENSVALANVRQIAWELRDTIQRHLVIECEVPYVRAPLCPPSPTLKER